MANVGFQAPTDYSAEQSDIERRRKYAEMLRDQSMQPLETQMAGGWAIPISPTQGLAKVFQAYAGQKGIEEATAAQKALAQRVATQRGQELANALRLGQGAPAQPELPANEMDYMGTPAKPAQAPNRQAMIAALAGSQFPDFQQQALAQSMKDMDPYTLGPGAVRMGPGGQPIASAPFKPDAPKEHVINGKVYVTGPNGLVEKGGPGEGSWGEPYELNGAMVQKNSVTGQVRQSVSREPQVKVTQEAPITAVTLKDPNDPNGTIVIDGRTKKVLGKGPKLTDAGKLENKRQFNMSGLGATIQEAKDLLTGTKGGVPGAGDKPTSSGIGAAVDFAGSLVGASPKGSVPAAQLKAIGGSLVSKMPRMEGPQSDKDVVLYKEMAGKVGDATVPIDQRVAALDVIEKLWGKYEKPAAGGGATSNAVPSVDSMPPPGAVRRIP